MTDITLSVCITTGRRPAFLDHLLGRIATACRFSFPIEVVVCDAGADGAARAVAERHAAAGLPVVYVRHDGRPDAAAHTVSALHRGRGRYLVALSDDALPIPDALAETVAFLDGAPQVLAAYAPAEFYDDVAGRAGERLYALDGEALFSPGDEIDLLGLLVRQGLRPDTAVFRAEAIRHLLVGGTHCHWSLVGLTRLVGAGSVAFRPHPVLRLVTRSPVVEARGPEPEERGFDLDRGGLEYFVQALFGRIGTMLDADQRRVFREAVDAYTQARLRLALRYAMARGDVLAGHEILCRLRALGGGEPETVENADRLPLLVAVQMLARFANGLGDVDRLILVGIEDGPSVSSLLREVGLDRRILVTPPLATPSPAAIRSSLVFLARDDDRRRFLDQGYAPGLIVSEGDLLAGLNLG